MPVKTLGIGRMRIENGFDSLRIRFRLLLFYIAYFQEKRNHLRLNSVKTQSRNHNGLQHER